MFRSSAQFSSKFFRIYPNFPTRFPANPSLQASFFAINGVQNGDFLCNLHSYCSGMPSAASSFELGVEKSEVVNPCRFSSSSAIVSPLVSGSKAKEIAEMVRNYGRCYWELSKARLSMLVVATSGTGFVLGSSSTVDLAGLCWTCAGTMMVAASANSLNQVFEIRNDAKMKRTMQRPLPSGRLTAPHAVLWASSIGVAGTTLLALKANFLAAWLAASNLALYAFVYTPLKQLHPVNTWVGAVVGAIPPLLGWAAASGQVAPNGMILPAALYFWQIPHFMALAYLCRNDYAAGGFQMFSLADVSGERTALVALRNCLYLFPVGFLAYNWGITSGWFCLESALVTSCLSAAAVLFYRDRTSKNARKMFHASLLYLPVFMAGLLFHRLPNRQQEFTLMDPGTQARLPFLDTQMEENVNIKNQFKSRKNPVSSHACPPVAYASIAPFPFLPAPVYFPADFSDK